MVLQILIMSVLLAAATFIFGMMPLTYAFSRSHLEQLNVLSIGLLLGTALGVIIPEGIDTISNAYKDELPTGRIAFCLIVGFILMLFVDEILAPNAHAHSVPDLPMPIQSAPPTTVEFDAELAELDKPAGSSSTQNPIVIQGRPTYNPSVDKERATSLLFGLVIHAAADGLALGAANLSNSHPSSTSSHTLSILVFVALILHKAPTSLAFTTSLLSTNLPRSDCKKYLLIFCSSTPLSALVSYLVFSALGQGNPDNITGMALLLSGGTFLYVATVIQPVSNHSRPSVEMKPAMRVLLVAVGMFIPLILSSLFEHDH